MKALHQSETVGTALSDGQAATITEKYHTGKGPVLTVMTASYEEGGVAIPAASVTLFAGSVGKLYQFLKEYYEAKP